MVKVKVLLAITGQEMDVNLIVLWLNNALSPVLLKTTSL